MVATGEHEFDAWHKLFDTLCNQRGWYDNAAPASAFCVLAGKNTVQDFEAAKKKLRSWRSGKRLPRRRNFVVLGQLLDVDSDPDLHRHWTGLYRTAQRMSPPDGVTSFPADPRPERLDPRHLWALGSLTLLSVCFVVISAMALVSKRGIDALSLVNFEGQVHVATGSSIFIHGGLRNCEDSPPAWADIAAAMPEASFGSLEDGGLARKVVRKCGGERVVRAVRYTGLQPGMEELRLFGDYIRVDVVQTVQ